MTNLSTKQIEGRKILDSLRSLVQVLQNYSKRLETDLGMSGAQLFVLQKVSEDNLSSINEIAEKTLTHQSSVSVVVDRLFQKDLVERKPDALDKRRSLIAVSAKGVKILRKAGATPQEKLAKSIMKLSDTERKSLAKNLSKILSLADLTNENPNLFFEPDKATETKRGKS
jgi:DNA-binding MarR family transcriptional regulator